MVSSDFVASFAASLAVFPLPIPQFKTIPKFSFVVSMNFFAVSSDGASLGSRDCHYRRKHCAINCKFYLEQNIE